MKIPKLKASRRETRGSLKAARQRAEGLVPGILYGRGKPEVLLTIPCDALESLIRSETQMVTLAIEGGEEPALVQDVQADAITGDLLHVDFARIALDATVKVKVKVLLKGAPVGVATGGGVLEQQAHEIEVECLPTSIPEHLTAKIDHLELGKSVHAKEIPLPEGVRAVDPERVVATVHLPKVVEAAAEAAPVEVALQPEVIGQKEREERAKEKEKSKGGEEKGSAEAKEAKKG